MNRQELEALCELLEHMSMRATDPAQKTMVRAAAEIRRLAEALEQIKFWAKQAIPRDADYERTCIAYLGDLAHRALDGEDEPKGKGTDNFDLGVGDYD